MNLEERIHRRLDSLYWGGIMKRLLLILITCLIGQLGLYAQNDSLEVAYRLSGLITDAQTGEPVPFVSVHNGPTWNTHTDMTVDLLYLHR